MVMQDKSSLLKDYSLKYLNQSEWKDTSHFFDVHSVFEVMQFYTLQYTAVNTVHL